MKARPAAPDCAGPLPATRSNTLIPHYPARGELDAASALLNTALALLNLVPSPFFAALGVFIAAPPLLAAVVPLPNAARRPTPGPSCSSTRGGPGSGEPAP